MSKKNGSEQNNQTYYMPIGMCLGISVGTALGVAVGNLALYMPIGLSIGLCIGTLMDAQNRKSADEDSKEDEEGDEQ